MQRLCRTQGPITDAPARMKLITLNLRHGGGRRMPRLMKRLVAYRADVLVLTEFRENGVSESLRDGLKDAGLIHQAGTPDRPRLNGVLVAARQPFRLVRRRLLRFDPVRLLSVEFEALSLVALHLPNIMAKIPHWEALLRLARTLGRRRCVYLGDFNTGLVPEDAEGEVFRFSGAPYMESLLERGWKDAWRALHPQAREYTWYSHRQRGFRLDHAFLSPPLAPLLRRASFDHTVREQGLSDHSALLVELGG